MASFKSEYKPQYSRRLVKVGHSKELILYSAGGSTFVESLAERAGKADN